MLEDVNLTRWLLGVIALILMFGSLVIILQKLQASGGLKPQKHGRLKVKDRLILDGRRRLVIVEHDDKEHLILLGHQSETLISTDKIKGTKKAKVKKDAADV